MKSSWATLGMIASLIAGPVAADCASDFQINAQATLQDMTRTEGFFGVVLVAVDGRPVLRQASGLANRAWGIANTPDSRFRIGSMTKPFTAIAVLQLLDQNKLSIDDPISRHYPAAPRSWADVTIRQLLTHTSGIPDYIHVPSFQQGGLGRPNTPQELVGYVSDLPLDFPAGSGWRYSNTGFVLLGLVVEQASGQSYADYVQDHIFTPVGMTNSGYETMTTIIPHNASGYVSGAEAWLNAPFVDSSNAYAAGGLYSTVDDLLKWDRALSSGTLLAAVSQSAMFTDYRNQYGFGWQVDRKWDQARLMHGGATPGFQSSFQRYPEKGVTVIALSNSEHGAAEKLATDLAGLCMGARVYPDEVRVSADVLDRYLGFYRLGEMLVRVARDGDRLTTRFGSQPPALLYATSNVTFFQKVADATMEFQLNESGEVTSMVVHQNEQDYAFDRVPLAPQRSGWEAR